MNSNKNPINFHQSPDERKILNDSNGSSNIVIEEDLLRAIIALRCVPSLTHWLPSNGYYVCADDNDGDDVEDFSRNDFTSSEYIWKANNFGPPFISSSNAHYIDTERRGDDESGDAIKMGDSPASNASKTKDGKTKFVPREPFPVVNSRIDTTSDGRCKFNQKDGTTTDYIENRRKETFAQYPDRCTKVSQITALKPTLRICPEQNSNSEEGNGGVKMTKVTSPLIKEPYCVQNRSNSISLNGEFRRLQGFEHTLESSQPSRKVYDATMKQSSNNRPRLNSNNAELLQDNCDVYERSLDILESEELKGRQECSSTRSNSPETLLEELLGSIPAEEFDPVPPQECNKTVKTDAGNTTVLVRTGPSFELLTDKPVVERSNILCLQKVKKCEMKTFMLTGLKRLDDESNKHSPNEPQTKSEEVLYKQFSKSQVKKSNPSEEQREDSASLESDSQDLTSLCSPSKMNEMSRKESNENELTPEDIFEEIMDSMETPERQRYTSSNLNVLSSNGATRCSNLLQRDAKKGCAQKEPKPINSYNHAPENEWMSVYHNRTVAGLQLCLSEKVNKNNIELNNTELNKSEHSLYDDMYKTERKSSENARSQTEDSSMTSSVSFDFPVPDRTKEMKGSSQFSQEAIHCTVKKRPAPPLREKVHGVSFAKKESLTYDFRVNPAFSALKSSKSLSTESKCVENNLCKDSSNLNDIGVPYTHRSSGTNGPNSVNEIVGRQQSLTLTTVKVFQKGDNAERLSSSVGNADRRNRNEMENLRPASSVNSNGTAFGLNDIYTMPLEVATKICSMHEDDMELDLDAEFARNLEACTTSDVECPSLDKLMSTELHSSAGSACGGRKNFPNTKRDKFPGNLGILMAKRKLQKSPHAVDHMDGVSELRSSAAVDYRNSSSQVIPFQNSEMCVAKGTSPIEASVIIVSSENNFNNNYKPISQSEHYESRKDAKKENEQHSDGEAILKCNVGKTYEQKELVESVQNGTKKDLESRELESHTDQVLSEEVTSQEILLKIVWPKKEALQKSSPKKEKTPFREIQLQRMFRISDESDDSSKLSNVDLNTELQITPKITCSQSLSQNNGARKKATILDSNNISPIGRYNTKKLLDSQIEIEHEKQTDSCRIEDVAEDSKIDVRETNTVRMLRVPLVKVHRVQGIKEVVAEVGNTILNDFGRVPNRCNIRVSCEATECKSQSSLSDHKDITIVRNTILDTLEPPNNGSLILQPNHSSA